MEIPSLLAGNLTLGGGGGKFEGSSSAPTRELEPYVAALNGMLFLRYYPSYIIQSHPLDVNASQLAKHHAQKVLQDHNFNPDQAQ